MPSSPRRSADIRRAGGPYRRLAGPQLLSHQWLRRKSVGGASKTSKADLVAALKQSFEICDTAYDSLTDASPPRRSRTPAARARSWGAGQEHDARQ